MRTSRAFLGIVAGMAAGAIVGVLLAPDSGPNTRRKISNRSQDMMDEIKSRFNGMMEGFNSHKDEIVTAAKKITDTARNKVNA
jgi:gas vesicle protein